VRAALVALFAFAACVAASDERNHPDMALPTSRNSTYAPGAGVVKAADLNDIQDAIIGGKHPEFGYPIAASGFSNDGGTQTFDFDRWLGVGLAVASLSMMRVGDRITKVRWGYNRNAAGQIAMRLYRQPLDSNVEVLIAPISGSATDAATAGAAINETVYNHTIEADYLYTLYFDSTAAANEKFGVVAYKDRL
jgi:hypothetical protein